METALVAEQAPTAEQTATPKNKGLAGLKDRAVPTTFSQRAMSVFGIFVLLGIAWLLSRNRKAVKWRPVVWGIGLQVVLGMIMLSPTVGDTFFKAINGSVAKLMSFSEAGSDFVFQTIEPHDVTTVTDMSKQTRETKTYIGHISPPLKTLAFWILPTIIFFSGLMNILYHLGVMQWLVRIAATIMQKTMGTSGSESLSAAANIFVGQTEAPLVVKPFIRQMTSSELFAVMVGGLASIAGSVMFGYAVMGIKLEFLLAACFMAAPGGLMMAKLIKPELGTPKDELVDLEEEDVQPYVNVFDAAASGALSGLQLALNVGAMLVAFTALIAMLNALIGWAGGLVGFESLTIELMLGYALQPVAWTLGIPWSEANLAGSLIGQKLVFTEFIAYLNFTEVMGAFSTNSQAIITIALCGFANFASIAILLGGIGTLAPSRRPEIAQLGLLALLAATLANLMSAAIAGFFLSFT